MANVLIVDDEEAITRALTASLERGGAHAVVSAHSGREGLAAFARQRPDVVLLDLKLGDMPGIEVLQRMRGEDVAVVVVTGGADVPMAVDAMRAGAENFLVKPIEISLLGALVDRAAEKARLRRASARRTARAEASALTLVGPSRTMRELQLLAERVASTETPALVVGEVGTGKGSVAKYLHARGVRRAEPLVERRIGGRGAGVAVSVPATGATGGGSLFVYDVADLDSGQQRWLGGIAEGGERGVRVIAGTARDLVAAVTDGKFDEALYYRLAATPLHLPPLRARAREDVAALVDALFADLGAEIADAPEAVSPAALERLLAHSWPGNVRELRGVLERAMLLARGAAAIEPRHLAADVGVVEGGEAGAVPAPPDVAIDPAEAAQASRSLADVERAHIERVLAAQRGNRTHAARVLGISRATLIKKIRDFELGAREGAPRTPAATGGD